MMQTAVVDRRQFAEQPGRDTRVPALDGLRGVAILLVLMLHFTVFGIGRPETGTSGVLLRLIQTGWIGVDLFLVLSGFLITGILYRAKGRDRFFLNFYARRTLRIFPLYSGFLVVAVVLLPLIFPRNARLAGWVDHAGWYWTYSANLFITLYGWRPQSIQGMDHFWSLAVEEQFYLLWPLAVYFCNRRSLIILCLVCGIGSIAIRALLLMSGYTLGAYVLMPARMDSLAAGGLVALLAAGPRGLDPFAPHARRAMWLAGGGLLVLGVSRGELRTFDPWVATVGYTLLAVMFASVLVRVVAHPHTRSVTMLRSSTLRFFGRYSYGLYVIHHPLLFLIPAASVAAVLQQVVPSALAAKALALLLLFGLTVATALVSWHGYEKQFLRLKDRFESPGPV